MPVSRDQYCVMRDSVREERQGWCVRALLGGSPTRLCYKAIL